jgi:hypothetical protein
MLRKYQKGFETRKFSKYLSSVYERNFSPKILLQNKIKFFSGRNGFDGTTSVEIGGGLPPRIKEVCHVPDVRSFQCNHNTIWALSWLST